MSGRDEHKEIVKWALQCATRVAELADQRATMAIGVANRWLEDEIAIDEVRNTALVAHRAAHGFEADSARFASRACAQAAGSALKAERAPHAASYARRAIAAAGGDADHELEWQRSIANEHVLAFLAAQTAPQDSGDEIDE